MIKSNVMKKIILLFLIILAVSCSKEDDSLIDETQNITISNENWVKDSSTTFDGETLFKIRIIATVSNQSNTSIKGKIRFVVPRTNGSTYLNSNSFIISANSSNKVNEVTEVLLNESTFQSGFSKVEFIKE